MGDPFCRTCGARRDALGPVLVIDGRVVIGCACPDSEPEIEPAPIELTIVAHPGAHPIRRVAVAASALLLLSSAAYHLERDPAGARMAIAAPLHTAETTTEAAIEPTEPEPPEVVVDVDEVIADLTAEEAEASAGDLLRFEDHPSLEDWVHPVMGSTELAPTRSTRVFGAERGVARFRAECGRGHCGVDLDGPRGTPILAVAWGEVMRVRRTDDGHSGLYVLIRHPEGAQTAYMHLDSIPEYLQVGDEVEAGEIIGTLGRTGIQESAPHLHFSLALPAGAGMRYADPAPYLERAQVLPLAPGQ
jgi:murein DD-endopeptidase MepM/ murein hydrolase activator NlpD